MRRPSPSGWSTRCAVTAAPSRKRGSRDSPRHVSRSAERALLHRQPDRRPGERRGEQRAQLQPRLEPGVDPRDGRFGGGWSFEAAFPFRSLRYRPGRSQVWGLRLRRRVRHKNETSYLTPLDPGLGSTAIFQVSRSATLVGLEVPARGRPIEIKPYVIGDVSSNVNASPAVSNQFDGNVGLDVVKYGVTENLTADFTLQHRLRAGRGRRAASQPHPLQPVLPRETGVLSREPRHVRLRRQPRLARWVGRHPGHVPQPADRPARGAGSADHRRRAADRPRRSVQSRADQHPDRRRAGQRRGNDELFGGLPGIVWGGEAEE